MNMTCKEYSALMKTLSLKEFWERTNKKYNGNSTNRNHIGSSTADNNNSNRGEEIRPDRRTDKTSI